MKFGTTKRALAGILTAAVLIALPAASECTETEAAVNDLYPSATQLKNDSPVTDTLGYGNTKEYKYTSGASGSFYFEVEAQYSCSVYVYDSNGSRLDSLSSDHYISKEYTASAGKVYYIVVGPSYSASNLYTITAHYEGAKVTEVEPNNSEAEANSITAGTRVYGYTSGFSDMDYYVFKAPSDGKLQFTLTKNSTSEDARWNLISGNRTYSMQAGDVRISTDQVDVRKGQSIYVLVENNASASSETYVITADFSKLSSSDITGNVSLSKGKIKKVSAKKNSISLTVGCDTVYGAAVRYQVRIKKSGALKYKTYSSSKSKITIKGLSKYTEYTMNVRPYVTVSGKKSYGKWSATKLIRTRK